MKATIWLLNATAQLLEVELPCIARVKCVVWFKEEYLPMLRSRYLVLPCAAEVVYSQPNKTCKTTFQRERCKGGQIWFSQSGIGDIQ